MDPEFIDSDALGLTFVREVEVLGDRTVVELRPGGKNIVVNSKNRGEYVTLLIRHRFVTSISEQIIGKMPAERRKVLLFFWTSIKYLPVEGFRGLASRLYIYKSTEPQDRLPSSHTCFYRLCFPPYPSMAVMQDRIRVITQEHIGCSFGTW
ncbi:E3 ubiquitin-protein ligase UPL5 [Linum perenne]